MDVKHVLRLHSLLGVNVCLHRLLGDAKCKSDVFKVMLHLCLQCYLWTLILSFCGVKVKILGVSQRFLRYLVRMQYEIIKLIIN